MNLAEVASIMETSFEVGGRIIANPYSTTVETLASGLELRIDRYQTIYQAGRIGKWDLTPVVFADDVLVGWGNDALREFADQRPPKPKFVDPRLGVSGLKNSAVGVFIDERRHAADWYGAIKGGFGNPLKQLRVSRTVAVAVQEEFVTAIQRRQLLASPGTEEYLIAGIVRRFDSSRIIDLEAYAEIEITVQHIATGAEVYRGTCRSSMVRDGGFGAGVFASRGPLEKLAWSTLREALDDVFRDPAFARALSEVPAGLPVAVVPLDPATRLLKLEELLDLGLVSQEEYDAKRAEILAEL